MAEARDAESDGSGPQAQRKTGSNPQTATAPEFDDFGLPIRQFPTPAKSSPDPNADDESNGAEEPTQVSSTSTAPGGTTEKEQVPKKQEDTADQSPDPDSDVDAEEFKDAQPEPPASTSASPNPNVDAASNSPTPIPQDIETDENSDVGRAEEHRPSTSKSAQENSAQVQFSSTKQQSDKDSDAVTAADQNQSHPPPELKRASSSAKGHHREPSGPNGFGVSEYSHQQTTTQEEGKDEDEDIGWQEMPAYAPYDLYDDDNRMIAREYDEVDENDGEGRLGGAGKGYTRVIMDEDAESATSMDENTQYLFKQANSTSIAEAGDEDARDAMSQMQATKDLLTEGQRIAYVGVVRLEVSNLVKEAEAIETTKKTKKNIKVAAEAMLMWGQKMMMRLYAHMEISEAEQVMIEQLADHGVQPADLTPALLTNARVQNPMAEKDQSRDSTSKDPSGASYPDEESTAEPPPPYSEKPEEDEVPEVQSPSQMPKTDKIDIDLRWTVLCDLFLVLIADSVYDARSRILLERVGASLDVSWLDICRFEKRITDALEMQQAAEKENWNEGEHLENRRKLAKRRRYVLMGLATVGGGLVIGLSAGLLAPVIGAGLAAGFTTIGVTGTSSFLAGAGGAAIITSGAAASGSFIGIKAANRRTSAVKTFEYRPLHNNKRVNLVVSVAGWLTGKVDDVRLPFSTVDPMMGDLYSVLWEPEMLRSMGDTINILATEVGCVTDFPS